MEFRVILTSNTMRKPKSEASKTHLLITVFGLRLNLPSNHLKMATGNGISENILQNLLGQNRVFYTLYWMSSMYIESYYCAEG